MSKKVREILASLPAGVIRKLQRVSETTGESVTEIIEKGIELFERERKARKTRPAEDSMSPLERHVQDPRKRALFSEIMSRISSNSVTKLSKEERTTRSRTGAIARAASMTPEQRKAIAKKAAEARWGKKKPKKN